MKKTILFALVMIFILSASTTFAAKSDLKNESNDLTVPVKTENKLTDEEISRLTRRVEEIRDMDKTNISVKEKRVLKKELKGINENIKNNAPGYYIGGVSLLLIIIIIILLV